MESRSDRSNEKQNTFIPMPFGEKGRKRETSAKAYSYSTSLHRLHNASTVLWRNTAGILEQYGVRAYVITPHLTRHHQSAKHLQRNWRDSLTSKPQAYAQRICVPTVFVPCSTVIESDLSSWYGIKIRSI